MKVYIGNYPKNPNKERKINVRIDKWDTWGMDSNLAQIIYPMLKQLKATKQGIPSSMDELKYDTSYIQQSPFDFYSEGDKEAFNAAVESWDKKLDEMIWAFGQLVENDGDWEGQFHSGEHDLVWVPLDKNGNEIANKEEADLFRMDRGPNDTHQFDSEGYTKHLQRMKDGFRMFGEHYMDLWD